jgi:hypothetical protein
MLVDGRRTQVSCTQAVARTSALSEIKRVHRTTENGRLEPLADAAVSPKAGHDPGAACRERPLVGRPNQAICFAAASRGGVAAIRRTTYASLIGNWC